MDLESQIGVLSDAVEQLQKSVRCTICLEIMVNPTSTKCGHSFCNECIMTVINRNRMAHCPLCNCKINRRTVKENGKAGKLVEKVTALIDSIGKVMGMDIAAHIKAPKSTQEALLNSPKVQRILGQSKLGPKMLQENSENCRKQSKEQHRGESPDLVSVSQVSPPGPCSIANEKFCSDIENTIEKVPRKKKVAEWLDKTLDIVTSTIKSSDIEGHQESKQLIVAADVHQIEAGDLNLVPPKRIRCYRVSRKNALVFTDVDKVMVDSEDMENPKKRKIESHIIENNKDNEIQKQRTGESDESDPYVFVSSQKTLLKTTRKSSRQKENKSVSTSNSKKSKIMGLKPLPVRYNDSETLSVDIYDTFDQLVVTANKTEPLPSKEEHSDSDDTVFLFRTPLEDSSGVDKAPNDKDFQLVDKAAPKVSRKCAGSETMYDKKQNSKTRNQRRARSKSNTKFKSPVKIENDITGLEGTKKMFEEPEMVRSKADVAVPLSPSKKVNHTVSDIAPGASAIKKIPTVKNLIVGEVVKQEMKLLEKENLTGFVMPVNQDHTINISKLNTNSITKSPGWTRISKSKKEFDQLKKREHAALNVSGGDVTKRNKIKESFKKVINEEKLDPAVKTIDDVQSAVDTHLSVVQDSPKTVMLDSVEKTENKVTVNGLLEKVVGESHFQKPEVSLCTYGSHDSFSDVGSLDSPASCKRNIHIKSLIALLDVENESRTKYINEITSPNGQPASVKTDIPNSNQSKVQLKEEEPSKNDTIVKKDENVNMPTKEQEKVESTDINTKCQLEIVINKTELANDDAEAKIPLMKECEMEKTPLVPAAEMKINKLKCGKKLIQNGKNQAVNLIPHANYEKDHEKNVVFTKRGRFNPLRKRISFIKMRKLAPNKIKDINAREENETFINPVSLENRELTPTKVPVNVSVQTSPTFVFQAVEKHTLELVGDRYSQTSSIIPDSSGIEDIPNIIPLPRRKSGDAPSAGISQADDIPTQKFEHPQTKKTSNIMKDKDSNVKQKFNLKSTPAGYKGSMSLSQFSNATTVKYVLNGRSPLDSSPEECNYSPNKSLTLSKMDEESEVDQQKQADEQIKANNIVSLESNATENHKYRFSNSKASIRGSNVSRELKFAPDSSLDTQTSGIKKSFKRIRSLSSSDSDSETLVSENSGHHSSGEKRAKHDDEDDIEVINLVTPSDEKIVSDKAPENGTPNSQELLEKVMANIEADLAVKRNRMSSACHKECEFDTEDLTGTPTMFTPIEYYESQNISSSSSNGEPGSAASPDALILGTLQQEKQVEIKSSELTREKHETEVSVSQHKLPTENTTNDGDCESDEGIVHPTPSKENSLSSRNTKMNWEQSEFRSISIGTLREAFKEVESPVKHGETADEKSNEAQQKEAKLQCLPVNSMQTSKNLQAAAVECSTIIQQMKDVQQILSKTPETRKTGFAADLQPMSVSINSPGHKKALEQAKPCFVCSGLPASLIGQVKALANMLNADFSNTFTPNTTHLILKDAEDKLAYKTLKYLYAVVKKIWVVSFSWVSDCIAAHKLLPEDDYEMLDSSGENGPYRARMSTDLLLSNFEFCCIEPYTDITKDQLEELLRESGASVVNTPEEIKFRSGVHNMILVQAEAKTEKEVQEWWDKFGVITIAHEWVLDSIGRYRVVPIWAYLMLDIEEDHLLALGYPEALLAADEELETESQT